MYTMAALAISEDKQKQKKLGSVNCCFLFTPIFFDTVISIDDHHRLYLPVSLVRVNRCYFKKILDLLPPFPRFFCLEFWIMETREYFHYISLSISTVKY